MTLIRDLKVNTFYVSDRNLFDGARWVIIRKDPCVGGFEIEFTTVESGRWWPESSMQRLDPDLRWPVIPDEYLIFEEEYA